MKLLILCTVALNVVLAHETDVDVSGAFTKNEIVPDVIDVPPTKLLHVKFPGAPEDVNLGNELKPQEVAQAPQIHFDAEPNTLYAFVFADPDAPSRQDHHMRSVRHWIVVNILGSDLSTGQGVGDFWGSAPPEGTGLHRYVLLVYKQQSELDIQEPTRFEFSFRDFAKENNLGEPIYGNFYHAQFQS